MSKDANDIAREVSTILSAKRQRNILILVLLLLMAGVGYGFTRYQSMKTELAVSEQNQKALSDSLRVSTNKVGDLVASKNVLIADNKNLADLNADLADEVKKEKGKVRELTKLVSEIKADTVYIENTLIIYDDGVHGLAWVHDTIYDEENSRHLEGISKFYLDSIAGKIKPLETIITVDKIKFNLVTGLREKDGNIEIFARSDYPGLETLELDGAIIDPKKHPVIKKFTKKKRWGIGPYVGVGLGVNTTPTPNVGLGVNFGIGVHYSLFRF